MKSKIAVSLIVIFALGAGGFLYLRKHRAAGVQGAAAGAGREGPSGKSGFIGDSGYLLQLPDGYEVLAEMRGKTELALFYPKGAKPTFEEAKYKALGIVRLEVREIPLMNGRRVSIKDLMNGVGYTLEQNKEQFTLKKVAMGRGAFQVDVTSPGRITQLFIQGRDVFYVFTGGDEELLYALARGVRERRPGTAPKGR